MSNELARYIATYIAEEVSRGNDIDAQTILDAWEAYQGGAR